MSISVKNTADNSHTLWNETLNEHYHSVHGALQESQHVFIQNGLINFLNQDVISIFEMGFGTGLNALLSWEFAKKHNKKVNYHTVEKYPIGFETAAALNYPELLGIEKSQFLTLHQADWNKSISLDDNFVLHKYEMDILNYNEFRFADLVFYDAFGPNTQPELWENPILQIVFDILKSGGICVTYCAKGQFKRNLKSLGFIVEALPGPPGKREMTKATKPI